MGSPGKEFRGIVVQDEGSAHNTWPTLQYCTWRNA